MHTLYTLALMFALSPNFWSNIVQIQPVRIVAIAGSLATLLQLLKTKLPGISGWWAVAMNVGLAITGVVGATALTGMQNVFTITTLGNVIVASLAAAGIHGTAKLVGGGSDQSSNPGISTKLPVIALVALALMSVGLTGCTDWERTTFQTLSASKTVIDQAHADYEARKIPKTAAAYTIINEAIAAQTLAVQSMETYEEIKATKGTASALQAQQAIVDTVLVKLPALISAVKGLYPKAPPAAVPAPASSPGPVGLLRPTVCGAGAPCFA